MEEEEDTGDEESRQDAEVDFEALLRGNRNEWRKAFRLLKRIAYGAARKIGLLHADAEDVASNVIGGTLLAKIRQGSVKSYEEMARFASKIAHDQAVDFIRREMAQKRGGGMTKVGLDIVEDLPDGETDPVENVEQKERREEVWRWVDESLKSRDSEVVRDKFQLDLSFEEIAEKHGVTIQNVRVILCRALRYLRDREKEEKPAAEEKKEEERGARDDDGQKEDDSEEDEKGR